MLGIQEFRNVLSCQIQARADRAEGRTNFAAMREKVCEKSLPRMDSYQRGAFELIEATESPSREEIEAAMQLSLGPLARLSYLNRNRATGKVRKVRAFGERVLNVIGAGHTGALPWVKKGGSQYRALRALCGRELLREVTLPNGRQGWEAGPELRTWVEAGGFV